MLIVYKNGDVKLSANKSMYLNNNKYNELQLAINEAKCILSNYDKEDNNKSKDIDELYFELNIIEQRLKAHSERIDECIMNCSPMSIISKMELDFKKLNEKRLEKISQLKELGVKNVDSIFY